MPAIALSGKFAPILLLLASNLFMTFAWYGHLRFKEVPLAGVVLRRAGASPSSNIAWRFRPIATAIRCIRRPSSRPSRKSSPSSSLPASRFYT